MVIFVLAFFLCLSPESWALSLFTPTDNYLIACGSSHNVTFQSRNYVPDNHHSSIVFKTGNSFVATSNSSALSSIYQSARVFSTLASYRFKIKRQGWHWVRLYFHPIQNSNQNLTSVSITVAADGFTLLNGFIFKNYNDSSLFKEFAIHVSSATLTLHFIPSNDSVVFVNAIEVVSIPDSLLPDQAIPLHESSRTFTGLSQYAFQTVYRLNMGGPLLTGENDTLGRTWENDVKYLHVNSSALNLTVDPASIKYTDAITPEIAPNLVYASAEAMNDPNVSGANFNLTWVFPVDPNFRYFVRVHLCDIMSEALSIYLVFNLYINGDIAMASGDFSSLNNDLNVPYFKDFIARISEDSETLTVSVGPDTLQDAMNATLNGLEIMKLSNEARSLDGLSSVKNLLPESDLKDNKTGIIIGSVVGAAVALVFVGFSYFCLVSRRQSADNHQINSWLPLSMHGNSLTMTKMSQKSGTASCISLTSINRDKFFTFREILDATNKFSESLLLGVGGFGRVYKGTLEDGTKVAVKRGNPRSEQGLAEFRTEIEMLSKLRHRHLVSLIGYCDERSEMILVYEYMANGHLRSHLYGTDLPSLSWKQRLEICIGAARGLHYLHTSATQSIIHRDVKTTNILLDENFVAKVADFGLSKTGPALDQTHVSTAVKGSFGYLDPEYFRRQHLKEKSDVYSFGVVLMEVLCTRPALNPVLPKEQVNIAEWAMKWQKKGMLDEIIDCNLAGKVNLASLKKYGETAEKCLAEYGVDRPSMGDVLWNLEYALQLEETSAAALMEHEDNSTNHIPEIQLTPLDNSVSMNDRGNYGTDDEPEDAATSAVFAQLVNPRGR